MLTSEAGPTGWGRIDGSRGRVALWCFAAGFLVAAALPPWGWWPLAFPAIAIVDRLLADQPARSRFWRLWGTAAVFYVPSLIWIGALTAPGYVIAIAFYAAMFGIGGALTPPSARARWLALPATWTLVEVVKGRWPFGGVPVSTLAHAEVASPLAPVVRLAGPWALIAVTVVGGLVVHGLVERRWRRVGVGLAVVLAAVGGAALAPRGNEIGTVRVAIVQGGGPQGTRAEETDEREVFERHLAASDDVPTPVDLVLWPENVVNVEGPLPATREGRELAELARHLDTTLLIGVVEGDGPGFHNSQVVIDPDGTYGDRYEKVRRVPFGEYVPFRSLLERIAGDVLVPRDAIAGTGPAVLDTDHGLLGVVISWEVFFTDRARDAIGNGGEILLNPTNGSSYTGTFLQTQQIASSRLRALETGRWVLQAAPTGFSAVIDPDGTVRQRTGVSERKVLDDTVARRTGETLATRLGDQPVVLALVALVALAWILDRRTRRP